MAAPLLKQQIIHCINPFRAVDMNCYGSVAEALRLLTESLLRLVFNAFPHVPGASNKISLAVD